MHENNVLIPYSLESPRQNVVHALIGGGQQLAFVKSLKDQLATQVTFLFKKH